MSQKVSKTKKGFSLVEVLFTLLVLSIGIASISALMIGNIKTVNLAKNQIVASALAQEGVELVKNLKDNNPTFAADVPNGIYYRIDFDSDYTTFKASNVDIQDKKLYFNGGFLSHVVSPLPSKFSRKVSIAILNDANPLDLRKNVLVTSFVSWNPAGIPDPCQITSGCLSVQAVYPDFN